MPRYQESILDIIEHSQSHLNAEQIFLEMKKKFPKVVQATIYNNLNALCKAGKIQKVVCKGQADCYDKNTRHDHLVCRICHGLSDIVLPDLSETLQQLSGQQVLGYDLQMEWICPECRRKLEADALKEADISE